MEDQAAKALTGGSGDKSVDSVFFDDSTKTVVVVQGKYRHGIGVAIEKRSDVIGFAQLAAEIGGDSKAFKDYCKGLRPEVEGALAGARNRVTKRCRYRNPRPRSRRAIGVLVGGAMFAFLLKLLLIARSRLRSRASLEAENPVLRQQVIVLSRNSPSRVWLRNIDRLIFVWLYRCFPAILNAITVVKPETVTRWHRRGFRVYWRWKSRRCGGHPRIDREIRDLIRWMSEETPLWGAPRIHGELLMLGIEVAQSTVAR